jgi:hypothetical protein
VKPGFRVANLSVSLTGEEPPAASALPPAFDSFLTHVGTEPDGVISAQRGELPAIDASNAELICDTAPTWSAWSRRDERIIVLRALSDGGKPWRHLASNGAANHWTVTTKPELPFLREDAERPHPLSFPVGELVCIELLARSRGALFHACGVKDGEQGYLLCGHSGAGKSTMARVLGGETRVLNDDRVIVTLEGEAATLHGTPWHGDLAKVHNESAPLAAIFFLEQSPTNEVLRLSKAAATRRLLGSCWLPVWSPAEDLPRVLRLCHDLASACPCFVLRFRPELETLTHMREACDRAC